MRISTYLTFGGNCREAMEFYRKCLGGRLTFQTVGESPLSEGMSLRMKNSILHATLERGRLIIMATDIVGESGLRRGNSVSLLLHCESENEIHQVYKKLSEGGSPSLPPSETDSGGLTGSLVDKFGNEWLLNFC
jgi:PhnB protein